MFVFLNPILRYHRALLRYYILTVDELKEDEVKAFDVEIERATEQFPNDTSVKFYKGLMLKLTDRKKEGNKVLRSIEFEEGKDNSEFLSDLTYLGMHLYNQGKSVVANAIYQEASRMHLFQSPHQRTLLSMPDVETKPIWTAELENNMDADLTYLKNELTELKGTWESIRDESLAAAKNMSEHWISVPYIPTNPATIVNEPKDPKAGNWSIFPLYMWGKKKNAPCTTAPNTCTLFKKQWPDATKCATCTIKFVKLDPKVSLQPICAPTNDKLRVYLGLSNADKLKYTIEGGSPKEGEQVTFQDGQIKIVDESYAHALTNLSDEAPVILLAIDFKHPNLPIKWLAGETKKEGLSMSEYGQRQYAIY